ncbi:MarR family winged helix-turn-helix transcriptional regulator [Promicromonospora sp. Populi]|uniref:MarR family winged helix-turn-helix transcriptional regulator n=1 Tax=Promicromonospora sp. Populi TaxID=3239420 RepID=UPI0034E23585
MRTQLDRTTAPSVSEAWSRVTAFASAVDASLDKWLADSYRIGLTEYRALGHLSLASDKELRVSDLAQQVGLNPSSTTRLVSRLEAKGLARRDVCSDDGRGVYAVIEDHGEEVLREVRAPYEAQLQSLLDTVDTHLPSANASPIAPAMSEVQAFIAR